MGSMSLFWWVFSTLTICVSSKYLLVEVNSNQLVDPKFREPVESGSEEDLPNNLGISDEPIPEVIENSPRMEMSGMIYVNHYF